MNENLSDEQKAEYAGMVLAYAYHCKRCNYLWLPKNAELGRDHYLERALSWRPKSCARCKSKQWNQERRRDRISPPIKLAMWVKEVFDIGRKEGIFDSEIIKEIKVKTSDNSYSKKQVNAAIAEYMSGELSYLSLLAPDSG